MMALALAYAVTTSQCIVLDSHHVEGGKVLDTLVALEDSTLDVYVQPRLKAYACMLCGRPAALGMSRRAYMELQVNSSYTNPFLPSHKELSDCLHACSCAQPDVDLCPATHAASYSRHMSANPATPLCKAVMQHAGHQANSSASLSTETTNSAAAASRIPDLIGAIPM